MGIAVLRRGTGASLLVAAGLLAAAQVAHAEEASAPGSVCGPVPIGAITREAVASVPWKMERVGVDRPVATTISFAPDGRLVAEAEPRMQNRLSIWTVEYDVLFLRDPTNLNLFAFQELSIQPDGQARLLGVAFDEDRQIALVPLCGSAAAQADAGFAISADALRATTWIGVHADGTRWAKEVVFGADGKLSGVYTTPMLYDWMVEDGVVVIRAEGEVVTYLFDQASVVDGRKVLGGYPKGEKEFPTRFVAKLTTEEVAALLDPASLAGTAWLMRQGDKTVHERVTLEAGGTVGGIPPGDFWIDSWAIEEGALVFKKGSSASFKFADPTIDLDAAMVLNGYLAMNPYQDDLSLKRLPE